MNKEKLAMQINEIQTKSNHLKRMRYWLIYCGLIALISIFIAWWGFANIQDPVLPNVSESVKTSLAWFMSIIGFLAIVFSVFVFIGIKNGKKHVLGLINELERKKK